MNIKDYSIRSYSDKNKGAWSLEEDKLVEITHTLTGNKFYGTTSRSAAGNKDDALAELNKWLESVLLVDIGRIYDAARRYFKSGEFVDIIYCQDGNIIKLSKAQIDSVYNTGDEGGICLEIGKGEYIDIDLCLKEGDEIIIMRSKNDYS